jgi:branched-chain amino acid aminotransferase
VLQKFDERNRDLIVNVGGTLSHRDSAGVSPFDSAVQGGDAVWEGLRLANSRIFALDEHLARLRRSAHALAFDAVPTDEDIIAEIRRTLAANNMRDGVHIRLTLTRGVKITSGMDPRLNTSGPTLIVLAEFKDPVYDLSGIRLITSSVRRPAPDCLDPKIHHNNLLPSILAKVEANVAGADDAVMLDHRGFIAETNATHIFLVLPADAASSYTPASFYTAASHTAASYTAPSAAGGMVLATPTTASCPEGITRGTVLSLAARAGIPVAVGDYTLPQLYNAAEVFVTGTMGGLAPVASVDGRVIGEHSIGEHGIGGHATGAGPVTTQLTGLYAELTASSGTVVV